MSVQKYIFPGLLAGIAFLVFMVSILTSAKRASAINQADAVQEPAKAAEVQRGSAPSAAEDGACSISSRYPDNITQWCGLIERYAVDNGIDPNLISAVMLQESGGKPDAYSKSGAVGLLQVMPRDGLASKFQCTNGPCFADRPSMEDLFDPEFNVAYGTRMLAGLINQTGDVREALKRYGPKDVGYYYADIVLGIFSNHR